MDGTGAAVEGVGQAQAAYSRGEIDVAYRLFGALDEAGALVEPGDLERYFHAGKMMGERARVLRVAERAFAGYEAAGDKLAAAGMALWIMRERMSRDEAALGGSWLRRAERLLEGAPACPAQAHLLVIRSFGAYREGDLERSLELATESERIAKQVGDADCEALALVRRGRALIRLAKAEEGKELIDEAMAIITSRKVTPTVAFIVYCSTIDSYTDLADYDRAAQWTEASTDWCAAGGFEGAPGICRVHRAELLRIRGDLRMAEREALTACKVLERAAMLHSAAEGKGELGMIRLQTGDLAGAEDAFVEAHEHGFEAQPGLALLRLRRGNVAGARASIARAIAERKSDPLRRAKLLPALVEIALADGDVDAAEDAADDLAEIATTFDTTGLNAAALTQRGTVLLARERVGEAIGVLRKALAAWNRIGAPYEVARVRHLLAMGYEREGDEEQATLERRASDRALQVLGAELISGPRTAQLGVAKPASEPARVVRATPRLAPGTVLDGRIELLHVLGEGAMGTVFEGRHRVTGRSVAVKVMHEALSGQTDLRQRMLQEAQVCGRIRHPNVVDVYDAGLHEDSPYVVLELLAGETLGARLEREGRLPIAETVRIAAAALDGLQAAHAQGIVHRDLKPENIFLVAADDGVDSTPKLLDFGISKLASDAIASTIEGAILGTPYYMAPEQVRAVEDIDPRADVYAMAAVLYELLAGEPPFIASNYAVLLNKILTSPFPSVRALSPEVPVALDAVILRAGAKLREERYADAGELARALRSVAL